MKVNFTISDEWIKKALKKENIEILEKIKLGKNCNEKIDNIKIIFNIAIFILAFLIFYNSIEVYEIEKLLIMGIGLGITIGSLIFSFKNKNKFSVEYIEKERFEIIKHRNRDILIGTGNLNKDKFAVEGILEIKDDFIEITFGKVKKIYGIDSLKKVYIKEENLILEFKSIKYYINKKYFNKENIRKLSDLAKMKKDKVSYEIKEKVFKEINLSNYFVANAKGVNAKTFMSKLHKMMKKEKFFEIDLSLIGLFLMVIGSGEFQNNTVRIGTFLIFLIGITPLLLKREKEEDGSFEESKEKNKFISNLNLKKVRVYLGEINNYIFIGDDITVVNKDEFKIKKDGNIVEIDLLNLEFLKFMKEEKEGEIILELNKTIPYETYLETNKKELNNQFKKMYKSSKIKKIVILYMVIIFILSTSNIKGLQGAMLILIAYGIFILNGNNLKGKINREFIKIKNLYDGNKKDISLNIKIFKNRVTIEENEYLKSIYLPSEIEVKENTVSFGKGIIPIEKFTETELKIIKSLNNSKIKSFDENKEIIFKGKDLSKIKDELAMMLEKMMINLFNGAFLGLIIWSFVIGTSIEPFIGIVLGFGTILFYFILIKTIKSEYKHMINGYINIYLSNDKLYIKEENSLKEYNLDYLDIEYEDENIIIKRKEERLILIKETKEIKLWFEKKLAYA